MQAIKLAAMDLMPDEAHSAYVLCWADGPHGAGFEWRSTEAELANVKAPEGEQTYSFFITAPFQDSLSDATNGCFHDHIQAYHWTQANPDKAQAEPQHEQTTLQRLQRVVSLKLQFWDALKLLETEIAPDGDFSDRANNAVIEQIDMLAAGLDTSDDVSKITAEHLRDTLRLAKE